MYLKYLKIQKIQPLYVSVCLDTCTGLFTASGHFDTPLISVVDGPIIKPFGVVIVITGWFGLVYNNA